MGKEIDSVKKAINGQGPNINQKKQIILQEAANTPTTFPQADSDEIVSYSRFMKDVGVLHEHTDGIELVQANLNDLGNPLSSM